METLELEKLRNEAIDKVIVGDYKKAIEINLQILAEIPNDIDAMMQLGHAYWQNGQLNLAKKYYSLAAHQDKHNLLAKKKLALLKNLSHKNKKKSSTSSRIIQVIDLIEEPGKTKTIRLTNIGKPEHISLLKLGEEVQLNIRKRKIEVRDFDNNFLGYLPEDISKRLISFINAGCKYESFIFSLDKNEIRIFVREITKTKKMRSFSSFVSDNSIKFIINDNEENSENKTDEENAEDLPIENEELLITPEETIAPVNKDEEESEEENDFEEDDFEK